MPAGLTFAGRAWDDTALLAYACAFERTGRYRETPARTPELAALPAAGPALPDAADLQLTVTATSTGPGRQRLTIRAQSEAPLLWLTVNGEPAVFEQAGALATASLDLPENTHAHSEWRAPYGHIVIACAPGAASYAIAGGTA